MVNMVGIGDKRTVVIPKGTGSSNFNIQEFADEDHPHPQSEFSLGDWNGRGIVHIQWRFINRGDEVNLTTGKRNWAGWVEVQVIRNDDDNNEDETGTETVTVPPKKTWGHNTTIEMDFDPAKTYSIGIRHNAKQDLDRVKAILKITPKVTAVIVK